MFEPEAPLWPHVQDITQKDDIRPLMAAGRLNQEGGQPHLTDSCHPQPYLKARWN
jgi:hypothetical protein